MATETGNQYVKNYGRNKLFSWSQTIIIWRFAKSRVADQHHFNADPTFHFTADPDLCSSSNLCESATNGLHTLCGSILSLHASMVGVHGHPWLLLEPFKLLNFYFNKDSDPAFHCNADLDPASKIMRIRVLNPGWIGTGIYLSVQFGSLPFSAFLHS